MKKKEEELNESESKRRHLEMKLKRKDQQEDSRLRGPLTMRDVIYESIKHLD